MKKTIITITMMSFGMMSLANYVAIIPKEKGNFTVKDGDSSGGDDGGGDDGIIRCLPGEGIDRTTLLAMIDAGDDITSACTSNIKDFSYLFSDYRSGANNTIVQNFNQDISKWDVSNGENFEFMFRGSKKFNQDISGWDVSKGLKFNHMFTVAESFNQDIGNWDVSSGKNFQQMFSKSIEFNQDIGNWNVSNGNNFSEMFVGASKFNQDIGKWDVSKGTDFSYMFFLATAFNQNIGGWDVSNATKLEYMFQSAMLFNQDIHLWDVENAVTYMGFSMVSALTKDNLPCRFNGNCSLDADSDGVPDHQEVYNGTDPFDPADL